jgi:hypothetical protein
VSIKIRLWCSRMGHHVILCMDCKVSGGSTISIFFNPEDRWSMFLQNVGMYPPCYIVQPLQPNMKTMWFCLCGNSGLNIYAKWLYYIDIYLGHIALFCFLIKKKTFQKKAPVPYFYLMMETEPYCEAWHFFAKREKMKTVQDMSMFNTGLLMFFNCALFP